MKRPEEVFIIKGDRARQARLVSAPVVVAFRVHYRLTCDAPGSHRVSNILWEHEVPDFVASVLSIPGTVLVENDSRPGGVENVLGWPPPKVEKGRDLTRDFWLRQASAHAGADLVTVVLPLLARAPKALHAEMMALAAPSVQATTPSA